MEFIFLTIGTFIAVIGFVFCTNPDEKKNNR